MGGHSAEALRLGKQTLCQLSYSRSAYAQSKRLLEREGHSSGRRRLPQRSYLDATALVQRITTHSVCLLTCATPGANTSRRSSSNLLVRWKPATANSRYHGARIRPSRPPRLAGGSMISDHEIGTSRAPISSA